MAESIEHGLAEREQLLEDALLLQLDWVTSFAHLPTTQLSIHTADGMASNS